MRPLRILLVPAAAFLAATACFSNPLERNPSEAGVNIAVDKCEFDQQTEILNVTFTVTSEKDYDNILIDGRAKDSTGTVVASSSTSVSNVRANEPVQDVMVLSPTGSFKPPLTCELTLNFAQKPFG